MSDEKKQKELKENEMRLNNGDILTTGMPVVGVVNPIIIPKPKPTDIVAPSKKQIAIFGSGRAPL